jgi:hypothetical protein
MNTRRPRMVPFAACLQLARKPPGLSRLVRGSSHLLLPKPPPRRLEVEIGKGAGRERMLEHVPEDALCE